LFYSISCYIKKGKFVLIFINKFRVRSYPSSKESLQSFGVVVAIFFSFRLIIGVIVEIIGGREVLLV